MFLRTHTLDLSYLRDGKTERGHAGEQSASFLTRSVGEMEASLIDLLTMLIMVIKYVFNTNVETNQNTLYISICLAETV